MDQIKNQGNWLDVGIGIFTVSLLAGAVMFIVGWSLDNRRSHAQKTKGPAEFGSIPPERHQNIQTVAAR